MRENGKPKILTVYMAGHPVVKFPKYIKKGEELQPPEFAFPQTVVQAAELTACRLNAAFSSLASAWNEAAAKVSKLWDLFIEARIFEAALRWAEENEKTLAGRYHHTKKYRTRKKYMNRIVDAYLEGRNYGK